MQNKTSSDSDYNLSESIKKENKNMTCKDGYCFIPNLEGNETINNENINIFDPIQINYELKVPTKIYHSRCVHQILSNYK